VVSRAGGRGAIGSGGQPLVDRAERRISILTSQQAVLDARQMGREGSRIGIEGTLVPAARWLSQRVAALLRRAGTRAVGVARSAWLTGHHSQ
jgi:hypothetical protein